MRTGWILLVAAGCGEAGPSLAFTSPAPGRICSAGDVDPRDHASACFLVSDKALAVGGGVLEAVLMKLKQMEVERPDL